MYSAQQECINIQKNENKLLGERNCEIVIIRLPSTAVGVIGKIQEGLRPCLS